MHAACMTAALWGPPPLFATVCCCLPGCGCQLPIALRPAWWASTRSCPPPPLQLEDWLAQNLPEAGQVGIDPFLHTVDSVRKITRKLEVRAGAGGGVGGWGATHSAKLPLAPHPSPLLRPPWPVGVW